MGTLTIRRFLADPDTPGSFADRAQTQRRARLLAAFPGLRSMTVLDLGGTIGFWRHIGITPTNLTLVNLEDHGGTEARMVIGDACNPPIAARDRTYDLIICNSVIDQVGGPDKRRQLADTIMRLAPNYWVQTADRRFPGDAYFLFPWFSRLPIEARLAIARRWKVTHMHTRDPEAALKRVLAVELQSRRSMQALFPDASLISERFCGVTKSLIAARATG